MYCLFYKSYLLEARFLIFILTQPGAVCYRNKYSRTVVLSKLQPQSSMYGTDNISFHFSSWLKSDVPKRAVLTTNMAVWGNYCLEQNLVKLHQLHASAKPQKNEVSDFLKRALQSEPRLFPHCALFFLHNSRLFNDVSQLRRFFNTETDFSHLFFKTLGSLSEDCYKESSDQP
jgi:hypothetical protein